MDRETLPVTYSGQFTFTKEQWEMWGNEWPPKHGERLQFYIPSRQQIEEAQRSCYDPSSIQQRMVSKKKTGPAQSTK